MVDRDRWLDLWAGYAVYLPRRGRLTTSLTRPSSGCATAAKACSGWSRRHADGEPVGLAHLAFHPSTWATDGYCYLEDLYVDRAARGGDRSRALFDAVFSEARTRGSERVYWHTQQFNGAARSLYDTVGRAHLDGGVRGPDSSRAIRPKLDSADITTAPRAKCLIGQPAVGGDDPHLGIA